MVEGAEKSLVVGESNTLERPDPGATHLCEDPPDEVDGAEHLLHGDGLSGTAAVDHTLIFLLAQWMLANCQDLLVEDHHHMPTPLSLSGLTGGMPSPHHAT